MALMQSCCCWRSVRRGSFACAFYTGIYFALLVVTTGTTLNSEHQYMWGNHSAPKSMSVLEPESMSPATIRFNVSFFVCSSFGVVSCALLLFGLFKDRRLCLLPWIINVAACSLLDVAHSLYLVSSQGFNPTTALVYTLSFFLLCLNVYSLLCVISQYQEYAAGRGRAIDDCEHRVPAIRYAAQPTTTTATSCLSSRRANVASTETKGTSATTATGSPSQSPTVPHQRPIISVLQDRSVSPGGGTVRKHVQFPDLQRRASNASHAAATEVTIGTAAGAALPTIAKTNATAATTTTTTTTGNTASLLSPPRTATQIQLETTRKQAQS